MRRSSNRLLHVSSSLTVPAAQLVRTYDPTHCRSAGEPYTYGINGVLEDTQLARWMYVAAQMKAEACQDRTGVNLGQISANLTPLGQRYGYSPFTYKYSLPPTL